MHKQIGLELVKKIKNSRFHLRKMLWLQTIWKEVLTLEIWISNKDCDLYNNYHFFEF